jgi:serine/threonine-protein kinase ATR
LSRVVADESFAAARKLRVIAMLALRRLVAHSASPAFLDVETSGPGQRCLQALHSSVRELRIAGG